MGQGFQATFSFLILGIVVSHGDRSISGHNYDAFESQNELCGTEMNHTQKMKDDFFLSIERAGVN